MDDNLFLVVRRHHLAAVHLVCLVVAFIIARRRRRGENRVRGEEMLHRRQVREEMLHELRTGGKCRELIRMSENAFSILCQKLESDGGLRSTQRMTIEEQVTRFLQIIGNDFRNRFVSWFYRRSGSATSMHFHRVLNAIISLEDQYLIQPTGETVQKEIQEERRFYPFFKDCIGAIDGTHIRVKVPSKDAPRYRGRKGYPTINVLVACTFDLKFTYVLSGWEGTASDSRIIKDALTREDKLNTPDGKFYLVDGGLPLKSTLIAPYRGVRYHLKEYSTRAPQNPTELFYLRHASLRNSIERAFGVLKRRFPIIRSTTEPFYSCETQSQIFLACCILHNYLLEVDRDQELEDEVVRENFASADDIHVISDTPNSQAKIPSFSKSKKRKFEKDDEVTSTLMSSINNVADAIGKSTKELCKVMEGSRARVYSEEEIYKELEIMGITSEEEIFNAYLFLVERPENARALFGCPLNKRVSMLGRMMGA